VPGGTNAWLGALSHVFLVSFVVGTADLQFLSGPSGPSLTSYGVASIVTVGGFAAITLLVLFGTDGENESANRPETKPTGRRVRSILRSKSALLAIGAMILSGIILLELVAVPVGHYTSVGPSTSRFTVGGLKNWSENVTLGGFGQLAFSWTEQAGYSENLVVTLTRSGGGPPLYSGDAPSGYEGLVLGEGTYTITAAQPSGQSLIGFSMTIQAGWYSSSPLIPV
jgi:hypothetical protein